MTSKRIIVALIAALIVMAFVAATSGFALSTFEKGKATAKAGGAEAKCPPEIASKAGDVVAKTPCAPPPPPPPA